VLRTGRRNGLEPRRRDRCRLLTIQTTACNNLSNRQRPHGLGSRSAGPPANSFRLPVTWRTWMEFCGGESAGERLAGHSSQELAGMEFGLLFTGGVEDFAGGDGAKPRLPAMAQPVVRRNSSRRRRSGARPDTRRGAARDQDQPFANCYVVDLLDPRWRPDASASTESMFRWMTKNLTEMVMLTTCSGGWFSQPGDPESDRVLARRARKGALHLLGTQQEDRARCSAIGTRSSKAGPFTRRNIVLVTKDGRTKWVVASWGRYWTIRADRRECRAGSVKSPTRSWPKRLCGTPEQKLRVDEERYRTLFENSPFPLWEEDFSE